MKIFYIALLSRNKDGMPLVLTPDWGPAFNDKFAITLHELVGTEHSKSCMDRWADRPNAPTV